MSNSTYRMYQYLLGGLVTLGTFIVYAMTVAPTLSYWDCGEFIACSYILGIPHPPGTPLYVLIGRVFSMLPISSDLAVRINYVSVVSSALAAGMAFFVMSRLIKDALVKGVESMEPWQGVLSLCGGISGALFLAFSSTHWNNAVEAEVYGASMFLILVLVWLALRWRNRHESMKGDKYLIAIGYVALLSLGVHMTVFLAMPVIFLYIAMVDETLRRDWRFWLTGLLLFSVAADVTLFIYGAGSWLIISVLVAISRKGAGRWGLIAAIMVASWVGYTSQLYIPIRSTQDPVIDENDPESFETFISFLERKQYGQTNMVTRMFTRRGTWANQFGDHANMGFYRYFKQQYGFGGWMMLPVIILGFYGFWWLFKRRAASGMMVLLLFLAGSVGLVLYMNFADGTQYFRLRPDAYMEVRNRDYFFTPGFIVFGMMMGLGLTALIDAFVRRVPKGKSLAMVFSVVIALIPLQTLSANWRGADRSRNYTPYDYAYNILQSCEPNAILFTGGDNDTFPLWCLQSVYGVRTDIGIVNLSLANTDWYVYQMKHFWGLPVTFSDDQILWTVPDRQSGGILKRPAEPYRDPYDGNTHYLFTTYDGKQTVTPAMMIVEHILQNNQWKRPIYFSGNPAGKSRYKLEDRTKIVGSVFQVGRDEANFEFDYQRTAELIDSVFLLRSYNDPTIGLDDNAAGLAQVYPEKELAIADNYLRVADTANAENWLKRGVATFPFYWRVHESYANFLRVRGDSTGAQAALMAGVDTVGAYVREMPDNRMFWYFWGRMCDAADLDDRAQDYLERAFYLDPYDQQTYQSYLSFLVVHDDSADAIRAARKWLEYYPDDSRARAISNMAAQQSP